MQEDGFEVRNGCGGFGVADGVFGGKAIIVELGEIGVGSLELGELGWLHEENGGRRSCLVGPIVMQEECFDGLVHGVRMGLVAV